MKEQKKGNGKLIIFSAPSGSGKSTIIKALKETGEIPFSFSVSATNRPPREGEIHGKDYYFLTDEEFRMHLDNGDFIEYCEVYPGRFYGTLQSEIDERCKRGENIVFDVDVEGGMNIKKIFGDNSLSVFIMPPSIEELRSRLEKRGTDSPEKITERVGRAEYEISLANNFDKVIKNDDLPTAIKRVGQEIKRFLEN